MSYRFLCNHCGRKFELETPDAKECPFCFWSSSVKREDALLSEKKSGLRSPLAAERVRDRKATSGIFRSFVRVLLGVAVLAGVGFLVYKVYPKIRVSSPQRWDVFSIKPPENLKQPEKQVADPEVSLSPQDKAVLSREVTVPEDRVPDAGEEAILRKSVPFQTGWMEKLASPVWTLEQYQKMIASQEAFYKMPFARSYRKKLEELFKSQYLAAADAFTKGDALAARNFWVGSLAFPLYSTDLKKHRAVALTMLRPFINDTLSKVSAMNQSLVDRGKKLKEQALSVKYQGLAELIAQKKWEEALEAIGQLLQEVDLLRKNGMPQEVPPQYPPSFGTIDADLQRPLMDLMSPSPSSTADLQPLQQDLVEKKETIETLTPAYLKKAAAGYQNALGLIREKKWQEAIQALGAIQGPQVLQQDAAEKVAVLGKMTGQAFGSSGKTS